MKNRNFSYRTDIDFGVPHFYSQSLLWISFMSSKILMLQVTLMTTLYSCETDIHGVALELQTTASKLFHWFKNNHLKPIPGKFHILNSTKKPEIFLIDKIPLAPSFDKKLLRVITDLELQFKNHVTELCLKVSRKSNTLCCILSSLSLEKCRSLMKAFIEFQFNYCPLIWMSSSRTLNYKINRSDERALRSVCFDFKSSFNELFDKDDSFTLSN